MNTHPDAPSSRPLSGVQSSPPALKQCPFCAEAIRIEAIVCRFCQKEVPAGQAIPIKASPDSSAHRTPRELSKILIGFVMLIVFGVFLVGLREVVWKSEGPSKAEMIAEIRKGIEKQSNVSIKTVELVRESSNKYTGFAETQDGIKIGVIVNVDGDHYIWKTQSLFLSP